MLFEVRWIITIVTTFLKNICDRFSCKELINKYKTTLAQAQIVAKKNITQSHIIKTSNTLNKQNNNKKKTHNRNVFFLVIFFRLLSLLLLGRRHFILGLYTAVNGTAHSSLDKRRCLKRFGTLTKTKRRGNDKK